MSMFDWQYNGPGSTADGDSNTEGSVVSSRFWIYWAVSAPLTLLTLLGWALWWSFESRRFDLDVAETLESAGSLGEPSWWRALVKKGKTQAMRGPLGEKNTLRTESDLEAENLE
jgi:hypothetical protein